MRRGLAIGLAFVVAMLGMPVGGVAAALTGSVQGVVKDTAQQNLSGVRVQVRSVNGQLTATGITVAGGSFSFAGIAPGLHMVEVVDASGRIVGTSAPISIAAGATATVTVNAAASGAIRAANRGGLFNMGTAGTVAVLAGAAALTIVAIVAAKGDASPSK